MLLKGKIPREEVRVSWGDNDATEKGAWKFWGLHFGNFQNMPKLIPTAVEITGVYI